MQINVTFRNIEPSPALKDYAEEKISRIKKYVDEPIEANIVLKVEKFRHIAEATIDVNGIRINGVEETEDMYSSIDMVSDKIESQIKKYKDKLRKRKPPAAEKNLEAASEVLEWAEEEEDRRPQVVKTEQLHAKPMDLDEAVMQLNLSNGEFLVFTNRHTNRVNVLYKRNDGDFGLIEPVQ